MADKMHSAVEMTDNKSTWDADNPRRKPIMVELQCPQCGYTKYVARKQAEAKHHYHQYGHVYTRLRTQVVGIGGTSNE